MSIVQTMGRGNEAGPGSKYDHASGLVRLLEAQGYGGRINQAMKNTIGIFWKTSVLPSESHPSLFCPSSLTFGFGKVFHCCFCSQEFSLEEEHALDYSISYKGAIFVLLRHLITRFLLAPWHMLVTSRCTSLVFQAACAGRHYALLSAHRPGGLFHRL